MATLHRVFKGLDATAFEKVVGEWLAQTGLCPDDPLSVDGKGLRGIHGEQIPGVHLVSAYANQAAAVLAQMAAAGKGRHGRVERRELWALYDPELNSYVGSSGVVGQAWPHVRTGVQA